MHAVAAGALLFATALAVSASAAAEPGAPENKSQPGKAPANSQRFRPHKGMPVFDAGTLDEVPKPKRREPPFVSPSLRERMVRAEALVEFVLNTKGVPEDVHVVRTNYPEFGDAAVNAVKQWRFTPGIKDGKPVQVRMQVPIQYSMRR